MPRALITGINGQDGSYLAELLLGKGYEVFGLARQSNVESLDRVAHLADDLTIVPGDLLDQNSLVGALQRAEADEVYNLAAQSQVHKSFAEPTATAEVNALGVTRLLEAIRSVDASIRFYQASTAEIFGGRLNTPQNEATPYNPRSPYGVAKLYAHCMTSNYRESHDLHASSGILFNHESPRRGVEFVTRKITNAVAMIKRGRAESVHLGSLDAQRDWGFAGDYVNAMWLMLQQDEPDDYVIATGKAHSVRDFCEHAFSYVGLNYLDHVVHDEAQMRPTELDIVVGDPSKVQAKLGWSPTVGFEDLIAMMIDADLAMIDGVPG